MLRKIHLLKVRRERGLRKLKKTSLWRKVGSLVVCSSMLFSSFPMFASANVSSTSGTVKDFTKGSLSTTQSHAQYKAGEVIVKFKSGRTVHNLGPVRTTHGLKERKNLGESSTMLLEFNAKSSIEQVIQDLEETGEVEYAEPNYLRKVSAVTDPMYNNLWGLKNTGQSILGVLGKPGIDIKVETAWSKTKGSSSIVVGIIDTGMDISHPDLKSRIWVNTKEIANDGKDNDGNGYIDDVNGFDFAGNNKTVFDGSEDSHGTHVAGTIAASSNTIGITGIAPNVKVMPLKFISASSGSIADEVEAVNYAKKKGVKIINMSIGGYGYSQAEYDAIKNANALFVVASGNEGNNNDQPDPSYPAAYTLGNIVSVAAVDNQGNFPSWSNYGVESTDLAAPGHRILSTLPGNKYDYYSGTSMATPHVTGVAALVLSKYPSSSPAKVKEYLMKTTTPLASLKGKVKTGGLVNAGKALTTDMTAPAAPKVNAVTDKSTSVTGTAEVAAKIIIKKGTTQLATGTVASTGKFTIAIPVQKAGTTLTITATDKAGNVSPATKVTVKSSSTTLPAPPTVNGVNINTKKVTGKTNAGYTVQVYTGGVIIGQATASSTGAFSVPVSYLIGNTKITVYVKDKSGNRSTGTTLTVKPVTTTFTDLGSVTWAKPAIESMASLGIINGVGDNKYAPKNNITRAQFATLIVKTLNLRGTATEPFTDVKSTDWFAKDVALAYKYQIINGVSSTKFEPNRTITRQEMAVMMVRAIKMKQSIKAQDINGTLSKFKDRGQIDTWARESVAIAVEQGLMNGVTTTTFSPKTNADRAQSAVIMYRFYGKYIK